MARLWLGDGVVDGYANELLVFADNTGLQVKVSTGAAWEQGAYYENDAIKTLTITAPHATNPRIDRVVLELDWVANTITAKVIPGTAAVSPTAPPLTQTLGTLWQISLAQVAVAALPTSSIVAGNVTDERVFPRFDRDEPVGVVKDYAGTNAPRGWLFCGGQAVSRATYVRLFLVIGTTFGAGNGTTTFNVPDARGAVIVGLDNMNGATAARLPAASALNTSGGEVTHVLTASETPVHQHGVTAITVTPGGPSVTHTHAVGSYAGANESAHTHGPGSLAGTSGNQSQEHQHFLAAADGHNFGTVAVSIATEAAHTHGATGLSFAGTALAGHSHTTNDPGDHAHTANIATVAATLSGTTSLIHRDGTASGSYVNLNGAHTHTALSASAGTPAGSVSGATAAGSAHGHVATVSGFTDTTNQGHVHTTTMASGTTSAGVAHGHAITGTSAASADAHTHAVTLGGTTDSVGAGAAHNNLQPWLGLNKIIKY